LSWKKILAYTYRIYFLLVKQAESILILKENKIKSKKLVIIIIVKKFIGILHIGFKNNAYFDCVTWKENYLK